MAEQDIMRTCFNRNIKTFLFRLSDQPDRFRRADMDKMNRTACHLRILNRAIHRFNFCFLRAGGGVRIRIHLSFIGQNHLQVACDRVAFRVESEDFPAAAISAMPLSNVRSSTERNSSVPDFDKNALNPIAPASAIGRMSSIWLAQGRPIAQNPRQILPA